MGPRAGLYGCGKFHHRRDSIPGPIGFLSGATTLILRDEKVFDVFQLVRYGRRTSLSKFGCKDKAKATGVKDLLEFKKKKTSLYHGLIFSKYHVQSISFTHRKHVFIR
jgi:hypothetical protein